jgi:hypothetical protein
MICDYNTQIGQMKSIQRNVISSKYTISENVHNVPRQNLKAIQKYLHNAHRILNQYTTIIKIL